MTASIYDIPVRKITGADASLGEYKGKVVLVVNVASKCGLTPQYEGLEELYRKYRDRGFVIDGFPGQRFRRPGARNQRGNPVLLHAPTSASIFPCTTRSRWSARTSIRSMRR